MNKIQITEELFRDIRKTFDFGFGEIIIYEPTEEVIEQYYEFMESINNPTDISGIDVVKVLIPLFTNLEISDEFLQENIHKLIESPPLWLREIQGEISTIVNKLSVLKIVSLKNTIDRISILDNLSEEDIKKYKNINLKSLKNKIELIDNNKENRINKLKEELKELGAE